MNISHTKSRFNFLQKLALFLLISFSAVSCRPDLLHEEDYIDLTSRHGKFRVETDYPYYSVTYRYGDMKSALTETVRNRKLWEKEFTIQPRDTVFFEVNAIKSNLPGTHLKADIFMDGRLISTKDETSECEDGTCPVEDAPSLQMETIVL